MKTISHLIFVQGKIEKYQRLSISLQQQSISALERIEERIEKSLKDNREADDSYELESNHCTGTTTTKRW